MKVHFPVRSGLLLRQTGSVRAVDGVSLHIEPGETLGLVGESGCGKTTTGRALLRLTKPTSGRVFFDGQDITALDDSALRRARRNMQMIFQDPYGSLNPRMRVEDIVGDPLSVHGIARGQVRRKRVGELLEMVGLSATFARRFPHEFSGGQRQRIGIARALSTEPKFIICDEPVSALDVSIQAQVLNVLISLRDRLNLTYLFIAHDLAVVRHFSDRVAVMYLGKIVEVGPPSAVYDGAVHPYTQALLSAIPVPDPKTERRRRRIILTGEVPSPDAPPPGCRFHNRCWLYQKLDQPERCLTEEPPLLTVVGDHQAACHFPAEARAAASTPDNSNANPVKPARLDTEKR
ncbi:MAG TPA: ABC transporter ATP-binding protein [Candidatus Limnocylindria bacterium]|nr:ABC transporter ATP-binding protein [Candidatus Limnocylindria bacterium]